MERDNENIGLLGGGLVWTQRSIIQEKSILVKFAANDGIDLRAYD